MTVLTCGQSLSTSTQLRATMLAELCASERGLTQNADAASMEQNHSQLWLLLCSPIKEHRTKATCCLYLQLCHACQAKKGSGSHLIVEYAGVFAGHVVTVTIACKAHIHIGSCQRGGQKCSVRFRKGEKKNRQAAENNRQN